MQIVPFEPEHVEKFINYGGQEHLIELFKPREILELKEKGDAFTAMVGDRVAGCAGVIELTKFRGVAWGLFQRTGTVDFLGIHMAARRYLRTCRFRRIEAYVDPLSPPAMRWIRSLGFTLERAFVPYFFPNGCGSSAWVLYPEAT